MLCGVPVRELCMDTLTSLGLSTSNLGPAEAWLVGAVVRHSTAMTSLSLSWNPLMGSVGAEALAQVCPRVGLG